MMEKVKPTLLLLLTLLLISGTVAAKPPKRTKMVRYHTAIRATTRVPLDFNMNVYEENTTLFITFYGQLYNADIIVTDANGRNVVEQTKQNIHDGQFLMIPQADSYPYHIEIDTPIMEVSADIVQE